ncbi:CRISPR-associated endonuclease Cas3'' [Streptomyces sp. NRRL F-2890]|uniref:CRISPR-associated endonuclease Cas3'' n=1 Tax=Streptomyces sp. NRRL F-2890 TaxID=1463845 RepID=UPI0004CC74AB|nr:CRISPR-associated endonuclease Cas3'' [Streptomyces sp. NRRL F-2890]
MVDTRLTGKSAGLTDPYPLVAHLIDTAMVCGAVWDEVLTGEQRGRIAGALRTSVADARRVVMFWAGLHDLGKIIPQFQNMILKDRAGHRTLLGEPAYRHDCGAVGAASRMRHEYATHRALPELLVRQGYAGTGGRLARLLVTQVAQLLGGHHGRYPDDNEPQDLRDPLKWRPELGAEGWAAQREQHVRELHSVLGRPPVPEAGAMPVGLAVVIAGVVIVSDWIASQEHVIKAQQKAIADQDSFGSPGSLRAHAGAGAVLAPVLVNDAGLGRAHFGVGGFREVFPQIEAPFPLQLSVEAGLANADLREPGILLVTAPTGEGKTETALYAASLMGAACGSSGLYFALPTQATANQMYGRLVAFAEQNLRDSASLTLLHGAAELFVPYTGSDSARDDREAVPRVLSDDESGSEGGCVVSVEAGRWLRRQGRGILAPLAVGTVDQALMAALPLRRNALRHLGLSGKTVVIDEAHAYDAYTHALLLRLLEWLGALHVPVVLLSATLTGDIAHGMMRSYLSGADPSSRGPVLPEPTYPGWLYASARTGQIIGPAEPVGSVRARDLVVDVRHVTHTYDPGRSGGRIAALLEVLDGVASEGGCVAVICTTVAESQRTFEALRTHYRERYGEGYLGWDDRSASDGASEDAGAGPWLRLMHARFPARRRAGITAEAEGWFGRTDKEDVNRPSGRRGVVLVATQVIEQSLDFDFDLIVSDLAPMAMLLQRAGRVWRHADPAPQRPAWADTSRLVVLAPVDEDGAFTVPAAWGDVYAPALLQRTVELLVRRDGAPVAVPGDVQELVDAVYAQDFLSGTPEQLMELDIKRLADDMARQVLAGMVMLPAPHNVRSLHSLTTSDADEELIRTRLGVESVQVLPVFETEDGRWLDEACEVELPESGSGRDKRFTVAEIRELLGYVAPLAHGKWRAACGPANDPPKAWQKESRLARLVLLPHRKTESGFEGAVVGDLRVTYDHTLGLVTSRME